VNRPTRSRIAARFKRAQYIHRSGRAIVQVVNEDGRCGFLFEKNRFHTFRCVGTGREPATRSSASALKSPVHASASCGPSRVLNMDADTIRQRLVELCSSADRLEELYAAVRRMYAPVSPVPHGGDAVSETPSPLATAPSSATVVAESAANTEQPQPSPPLSEEPEPLTASPPPAPALAPAAVPAAVPPEVGSPPLPPTQPTAASI